MTEHIPRYLLVVYAFTFVLAVATLSALTGAWIALPAGYNSPSSENLPAEVLALRRVSVPVRPIDVLVRVVPASEIPAHCGVHAVACSTPGSTPCVVWMPSSGVINLYPRLASAYWADERSAQTFPHELAHCLYGDWHREMPFRMSVLGAFGYEDETP